MKRNQARYGFVIADVELVSVKRPPNNGEFSRGIFHSVHEAGNGQLTVLPGSRYLGMVTAGNDWQLYVSLIVPVSAPNQSDLSTYLIHHEPFVRKIYSSISSFQGPRAFLGLYFSNRPSKAIWLMDQPTP